MKNEHIAKGLKSVLDAVIKNEQNERYTCIMYQPEKPASLKKDVEKKNN